MTKDLIEYYKEEEKEFLEERKKLIDENQFEEAIMMTLECGLIYVDGLMTWAPDFGAFFETGYNLEGAFVSVEIDHDLEKRSIKFESNQKLDAQIFGALKYLDIPYSSELIDSTRRYIILSIDFRENHILPRRYSKKTLEKLEIKDE